MRKILLLATGLITTGFAFYFTSCNNATEEKKEGIESETKTMSKEDMIKRGDYIVTAASCNDCHTPKIFGPGEPALDSAKLLSGHPSDGQTPPLEANAGKQGGWMYFSPDLTSFVGPWGISYSANLTPDSSTGIGLWTEAQFISTIRNGKHLANGRRLLPPMPWYNVAALTDEDLKAVFAYLKSLPAVINRVPAPVTPPELEGMKRK
jgi:mono/diheme cytochrome c family protein